MDSDWTAEQWQVQSHYVGEVFTPAVPISESELFAGRQKQLTNALDAINQLGQHAIIYGERGVGKTSLANVLSKRIVNSAGDPALAPKVNCTSVQSFHQIWKEVFEQVCVVRNVANVGFTEASKRTTVQLLPTEDKDITPGTVCSALTKLVQMQKAPRSVIVILDEFDRVPNGKFKRSIADTIKSLSDRRTGVTVIAVGVADTVGELIAEHQSIERAITQIHMPRMETSESNEILEKGMQKLAMKISPKAKKRVASLSQGLPSYTHRLALRSARQAISCQRLTIRNSDVAVAVEDVVQETGQSLREIYRQAVTSSRADNLFEQVLLACACARVDRFGYFAAADVREPMSRIMGRKYEIPNYAGHLKKFCENRGPVLKRDGQQRNYRYRFVNPLMQPYVIMNGIVSSRLNEDISIVEGSG